MKIRVKYSIIIIMNAPLSGRVEVSVSNSAYFLPFNFQFSLYLITSRWVEVVSGVRRVRK